MGRGKQKSKARARPRPAAATAPVRRAPIERTVEPAPRPDRRRWIYGGLDVAFGLMQAFLIWKVVPNRLPSASLHLWTVPVLTLGLGLGTMLGGVRGWWVAIVSGSALLLSTILLILRIVISAAFLSGVYGAFGKAAAMTALTSIALLVELVALLPIVQIKYLMTRAGRRAFGVSARR